MVGAGTLLWLVWEREIILKRNTDALGDMSIKCLEMRLVSCFRDKIGPSIAVAWIPPFTWNVLSSETKVCIHCHKHPMQVSNCMLVMCLIDRKAFRTVSLAKSAAIQRSYSDLVEDKQGTGLRTPLASSQTLPPVYGLLQHVWGIWGAGIVLS